VASPLLGLLAGLCSVWQAHAAARGRELPLRGSVVKIYATVQAGDFAMPWQSAGTGGSVGSGFVVGKRRLLTNAHIVSDARFIEVQKEGEAERYVAAVEFVGHDCDLATLRVEDESFFKGTHVVSFGDRLPDLNEEVTVLGYPRGGIRLSLTRGVVSRIDYSVYSHSAVDLHLVLQVDAAINAGNSGGPVIYNGRVIGVAFQTLQQADNIGYAVPIPVIQHFLSDIADGAYNGYPEAGLVHVNLRNPALRKHLGLRRSQSGLAVSFVDPFGSAYGRLAVGDVVLDIDGYRIANDGTIKLGGEPVSYTELFERKQWGETVRLTVWRNGGERTFEMPLKNPPDPFAYRNVYDRLPTYYTIGGLVFSPLTSNYLRTLGRSLNTRRGAALRYYMDYAKRDNMHRDRDEFVVLIRRLAHSVNTYCEGFLNGVVAEVNGRKIRRLRDLKAAFAAPRDGFHVVRFVGMDDFVVLDVKAVEAAEPELLRRYGVPAAERFEDAAP